MTARDSHGGRGVALLSFATFLWGSTFVVTQKAIASFPPGELVLGRFLIAGIVFLPFLRTGKLLWRAAFELGITLWAGFALQTIGLKFTSVNRCAFITSTAVIFVPLFSRWMGRPTRAIVWAAGVIALAGVFLLSHDGSPPNLGDVWTVLSAMVWAIYNVRLEHFSPLLPSRELTAAHLWVVVILSGGWVGLTGISHVPIPWTAVLYLGLIATAATTWFQTVGQKWVPASRAAVLYTMEPVWASLFAWAVLGDVLGRNGRMGAALIVTAGVITQLRPTQGNRI